MKKIMEGQGKKERRKARKEAKLRKVTEDKEKRNKRSMVKEEMKVNEGAKKGR